MAVQMAAQEQLNESQATAMAAYIMTLAEGEATAQLPLEGTLSFSEHQNMGEGSSYLMTVSYQDEGSAEADPIMRDMAVRFRAPVLLPGDADLDASTKVDYRGDRIRISDGDLLVYDPIDFSGLHTAVITYRNTAGAILTIMAGDQALGSVELERVQGRDHQVSIDLDGVNGMHPLVLQVEAPEGSSNETNIFVIETISFPAPR